MTLNTDVKSITGDIINTPCKRYQRLQGANHLSYDWSVSVMACSKIPHLPGIYLIRNLVNDFFYVGSGVSLRKRWLGHKWYLRRNKHHNPRLQNAWNKYGETSFEFFVLEIADDSSLLLPLEQKWLDVYGAGITRECYNFCAQAYSHKGRKRSKETREKLSRAQTGKTATPEARLKMRAAKIGRKLTPEHIEKVAQKSRGRRYVRTEEFKWKSRTLTVEQVAEIRQLREQGCFLYQIASRFHIGISTVSRILKGESYKGVGVSDDKNNGRIEITIEAI